MKLLVLHSNMSFERPDNIINFNEAKLNKREKFQRNFLKSLPEDILNQYSYTWNTDQYPSVMALFVLTLDGTANYTEACEKVLGNIQSEEFPDYTFQLVDEGVPMPYIQMTK